MAAFSYHSSAIKHYPIPCLLEKIQPALVSPNTSLFIPWYPNQIQKIPVGISCDLAPKARIVARRKETIQVQQLQRPLLEYMRLPASQYSVLDAERIERVDDNTFRCFVYRFKFFSFEVCPVLLVRVQEQPHGCSINLLSCKLEGSPIVVAQNDKFEASMVNCISCDGEQSNLGMQNLTSDAVIELEKDYQAWASGDTSRQPLGTGQI